MNDLPRKRFGQNCCPESFFYVFRGARKAGVKAVDNFEKISRTLGAVWPWKQQQTVFCPLLFHMYSEAL